MDSEKHASLDRQTLTVESRNETQSNPAAVLFTTKLVKAI